MQLIAHNQTEFQHVKGYDVLIIVQVINMTLGTRNSIQIYLPLGLQVDCV